MTKQIWINIGSDNGLYSGFDKQIPELMLTYHQMGSMTAQESNFTENKYLIC